MVWKIILINTQLRRRKIVICEYKKTTIKLECCYIPISTRIWHNNYMLQLHCVHLNDCEEYANSKSIIMNLIEINIHIDSLFAEREKRTRRHYALQKKKIALVVHELMYLMKYTYNEYILKIKLTAFN